MNTTVREHQNGHSLQREQFVAPPSSVMEDKEGYTLHVEMPGVNKEGLEISVENNELTILGHRSLPSVEGTMIHRESRTNNFLGHLSWIPQSTPRRFPRRSTRAW